MKKFIKFLLVIVSVLSFFILFNEFEINNLNNIKNVERGLDNTYKVYMPNEISKLDNETAYGDLIKVLDKYKASIYYSKLTSDVQEGVLEDIENKYIYLNDNSYFDKLKLSNGRYFSTTESESDLFLSIKDTKNENQIGQIAAISNKEDFSIYTLKNMVDNHISLEGYCYIQVNNQQDINNLLKDLESQFNIQNLSIIEEKEYSEYTISNKWILFIALYILICSVILYDLLKSYKAIAIKKMLGLSTFRIYLDDTQKILINQLIIQAIVSFILGLLMLNGLNYYTIQFIGNLIYAFVIQAIILLALVSIVYLYVNKIKLISMIKMNKPTKQMIILNCIFKCALILCIFVTFKNVLNDFYEMKNIYSKDLQVWEQTYDYAIIDSIYNLPREYDTDTVKKDEYRDKQRRFYEHFNERGSILADFSNFQESIRDKIIEERKESYIYDQVYVNPNYLEVNLVYDVNGNKVRINESETATILLVPDKYKNNEYEIIEYYKNWDIADGKNGDIDIIWIKSNQKLFSYNLEVNKADNNFVEDPIIDVVTESNAINLDYLSVMAYLGNPFKIKLDNTKSIEDNIRPVLKEIGLSEYVIKINRASDLIAYEMKLVKEKIKLYIGNILLMSIILIFIILQNTRNFFNQYKQYLAIRYLQGYSTLDKYREYILIVMISWIFISGVTFAFNIVNFKEQIVISTFLIIIEIILSLYFLKRNNDKNINSVIKGS